MNIFQILKMIHFEIVLEKWVILGTIKSRSVNSLFIIRTVKVKKVGLLLALAEKNLIILRILAQLSPNIIPFSEFTLLILKETNVIYQALENIC